MNHHCDFCGALSGESRICPECWLAQVDFPLNWCALWKSAWDRVISVGRYAREIVALVG